MKIGIIGGSFDPMHQAHLQMGKYSIKQLGLDQVWYLVSQNTPLKNRELTTYDKRVELVGKMIKPFRKMKVCTIEKDHDGVNYTIDTMKKLIKKYPNNQFVFIIGGDQAANIDQWKSIDELKELVDIAYFERPGYLVKDNDLQKLDMPLLNISSTSLRQGALGIGDNPYFLDYLVHNPAILLNYMSEYRYKHSLEVAKMAKTLAQQNNLDQDKAYLAGLLHDINKEFKVYDVEQSRAILEHMHQDSLLERQEGCWHGYTGAFYAIHHLHLFDKDVIEAIRTHVLGNSNNRYAIITYLADKLELTRDYPHVEEYRQLAYQNIYKAHKLLVAKNEARYNKER